MVVAVSLHDTATHPLFSLWFAAHLPSCFLMLSATSLSPRPPSTPSFCGHLSTREMCVFFAVFFDTMDSTVVSLFLRRCNTLWSQV
jgi:hypothetical protein